MAREGEIGRKWPQLEREVLGALASGEASGNPEVTVVQTEKEDRGIPQVREALKSGVKRVVVVGGDGTLSDVVQGFFEGGRALAPDASLALVPGGRGDDFFKSLLDSKSSSDFSWRRTGFKAWEAGLRLLQEGRPSPMDVARLRWLGEVWPTDEGTQPETERYFVNVLSFGFPGLVVQKVKERTPFFGIPVSASWLGRTGATYVLQSLASLMEYRAVRARVSVDGVEIYSGPLWGAFVLNGAYNAGGVRWSNLARLDDGLLDLLVLEPRGLTKMLALGPQMWTGQWKGTSGAHVARGRKIELILQDEERKSHPLFDVDGDQPEPDDSRGVEIEVIPGAIQVWK